MTTRPAKLPFLLCGALTLVGCQRAPDANGSQAIAAGVTTVHTSAADTVSCADSAAYEELQRRLEERMPQARQRQGQADSIHRIEIRLDREAGTLSVSEPHVTVHPGDRVEWSSEYAWSVLFMKAPSSPLRNGRRIVQFPGREDHDPGARIRSGPQAVCGAFDYTVVVEEGGRMYTLDPEVWVLRA